MTTKNKNIPTLRFPEFTEEWEEKKLGEFSQLNPSNKKLPTKFIYIDLESVEKGMLLKEDEIEIDNAPSRAQRLLEIDDIIFQTVRPYQKNNFYFDLKGDYVASTGYAQIRTKNNSRFLYQFLHTQNFVDNVMERSTGTSYPAINSNDLAKISIKFPTLPEQTRIAQFLTSIDAKIQQLTKKKTLLEKYKKSVMQKIFNLEIRFKDDNGNDFPEWEEKCLGEIAKIYDGTHLTPNYVEEGIPFYSVEQVTANDFSKTKFISREVFEKENERVKIEKGDILMTKIGDIGTSKYIDWDVQASFYVSLALIKQSNHYNSKFLNQYIKSVDFQQELHKKTIHVAFPRKINLGEISNCLVNLPCLPEQQKIAVFLSSLDKKIELVNVQLEKSKLWKKGLLHEMFV